MGDEEDGFVSERWTFAGFRTDHAGKGRWHEWYPEGVTEDGTGSLTYDATKSGGIPVVGGVYQVPVKRDGTTVRARLRGKTYVGVSDDAELIARVEAQHRTNSIRYRKASIERSDKRRSPIDEALGPVLDVARGLPPGDRDAFALYVLRKIQSAW